ncbi:hypothetical protein LIMNO130_20270 [Limnobacter sp. 130]|uniref:restriction endonuclease subunit S n=1 Tax=Limnobacter sp. 130 TaxID=2653147 RepID=UPI0012F2348B|nr:restriction endonuclease subunit S [Limnobacter sp. 130]VWX33693.1 hypothetical protein LIMNO130_20270 [Limnobacter sp. 130]
MSWETKKLNEVANVFSGYAFKSSDMDKQAGIPLIKIKNIHDKKVDKNCETFLNPSAYKKNYQKFFLQKDDFLVAMTGQGSVGRIGKMRSFTEGFLVNQRVGIVRVNKAIADPEFIYQSLATDDTEGMYFNLAMGAGQPNLSPKDIGSANVPFPPLPIQQKIAGILAAYDDLIENNLKRIKLLEEKAQITYEEWFVRLRFPGHESTTIDPETSLPEGWETKAISSICDVNKNSITARNPPEEIRYIDISSAETGYYTTPQEMSFAEAPSRARRRVAFGDTIFSTVRPNRRIFSLVLENDPLLVASTGFAVLTPHRAQNFPFIYITIAQQSFTDAAVAVAGGAAYPAVNQTDFERIKITVPTQELMNKFSDAFVPNFRIKGQLQRENVLLREARDILLPRLMTGVIEVESYDPAQLLKEAA